MDLSPGICATPEKFEHRFETANTGDTEVFWLLLGILVTRFVGFQQQGLSPLSWV